MSIIHSEMMDEAEQWVIQLDLDGGRSSLADLHAFETWRGNPEHAAAYEKAQQFWRAFGQLSGHANLERLAAQTLVETAPGARSVWSQRLTVSLAASVTICVLAAGAFFVGQHYTPTDTYTTASGQRSTVQLDDGSQVILNVATRLDVKLTNRKREFTLKTGEAVFTVAEDPRRPFVVRAGEGEVTALGTRFQVRHESEQVIVTLLEGRVAVDHSETRQYVQLSPGDQVKFTGAAPQMSRRTVDPGVVSSWTTGRLKFRGTPVGEVLEEVNRYSAVKIRLRDDSLVKTPIDGAFEVGDTASVVSALEGMLPVEVARQDDREIVLVRK